MVRAEADIETGPALTSPGVAGNLPTSRRPSPASVARTHHHTWPLPPTHSLHSAATPATDQPPAHRHGAEMGHGVEAALAQYWSAGWGCGDFRRAMTPWGAPGTHNRAGLWPRVAPTLALDEAQAAVAHRGQRVCLGAVGTPGAARSCRRPRARVRAGRPARPRRHGLARPGRTVRYPVPGTDHRAGPGRGAGRRSTPRDRGRRLRSGQDRARGQSQDEDQWVGDVHSAPGAAGLGP